MTNRPKVITVGIAWDSESPPVKQIRTVFNLLEPRVPMTDFVGMETEDKDEEKEDDKEKEAVLLLFCFIVFVFFVVSFCLKIFIIAMSFVCFICCFFVEY